ncbi:MAG: HDIG domain-containing protein [Bacteroidales bacterium]|nr:HDIG domain-containing protein [Bacteroidales bacterium]
MNRYNHPHKLTKLDYILRIIFVLGGIVLLGFFCPRESSMQLHYRIGEPWDNNELIARDSFDIYKSESKLKSELDSMKRYYEPYYEKNALPAVTQTERLKHDLDSVVISEQQPRVYVMRAVNMLQEAYDGGILPDSSYNILQERNTGSVHVFAEYESENVPVERLKSERMTYEMMMAQDSALRALLLNIKLDRYIKPNLVYDADKSINQQQEINKMVTVFAGRVQVGEKIVDKGQIVTPAIWEKLASYERHENERLKTPGELWSRLGGQLLYITLAIICLFFFFQQFRSDYIKSLRHSLLIWLLVLTFPIITYVLAENDWTSPYIIPYCMLPIILRVFMDSRTAFISHLVCIMLCAVAIQKPFEFFCIQTMAGLTAIYALKHLQQRSDLFTAVMLVIGVSEITNLCFDLLHMNFFNTEGVNGDTYIYLVSSGGLLLLSYPLLFPIEKLFRFTSTVTLVELSNANNPVLRRLSEEAPGTFQHSMQVANLAAEVANKVGANAQLVRTGALYHDIGKLKNPEYFTENQNGVNPHNAMPFEDSAQVIIQHVMHGLELAGKYRLPKNIKAFIASHHGRSKTKFFYVSYINQNPGKEVNDEIFTYPGPNPATIEEAILMMADSVEAASRSLKEYTEESVSTLVDRIIDSQVKEGFFNHCPITFENIETCKQVFKNKLKSIYHTRISYPELKR